MFLSLRAQRVNKFFIRGEKHCRNYTGGGFLMICIVGITQF